MSLKSEITQQLLEKINLDGVRAVLEALLNPELVRPDYELETIHDFNGHEELDPQQFKQNFDLIIFDLDGTLTKEGDPRVHDSLSEILEAIKESGIHLASLTNKISRRSNIFERINKIPVYSSVKKKPHPAGYQQIMDENKVTDPARVLFVGDSSSTDILGAKRLGLKTVHVNYKKIMENGEDRLATKRWFGRPLDRTLAELNEAVVDDLQSRERQRKKIREFLQENSQLISDSVIEFFDIKIETAKRIAKLLTNIIMKRR